MTTPPTPAGWYPDPDGTGGQRYWDGSAWTDQRSPAAPTAAEPADVDEPTAVVSLPSRQTDEGARRDPDPGTQSTDPVSGMPTLEPPGGPPTFETPPMPSFDEPTTTVTPTSFDAPTTVTPTTYETPARDTPSFDETPPPPQAPPPYFDASPAPGAPSSDDDRKKLLTRYLAACAALLALLVLAVIYGVFINDNRDTLTVGAGNDAATTSQTPAAETTTAHANTSTEQTATASPSTPVNGGEASDGPLSFTIHGVDLGPTVTSSNAPVQKDAQGQYAVVHMTVTNNSDQSTSFVATFQKLKANDTVYNVDDEATFYLDSGLAEIAPGESADFSIAFDIPPGAVPQAIELHTDPMSAGTEVPLP
jgi:hypothetical protein